MDYEKEIYKLLKEIHLQLRILNLDPSLYRFEPKYSDFPVTISAGNSRKLVTYKEEGFLTLFNVTCSSKDTEIIMYLDDNKIEGKPSSIFEESMMSYNPRSFWLSKYDEENNKYTVWFTPSPFIHYYERLHIIIEAPENEDVTYTYKLYRYVKRR